MLLGPIQHRASLPRSLRFFETGDSVELLKALNEPRRAGWLRVRTRPTHGVRLRLQNGTRSEHKGNGLHERRIVSPLKGILATF